MTDEGSTGKIMLQIAENARNKEHNVFTCIPYPYLKGSSKADFAAAESFVWGSNIERKLHNLFGRITGLNGILSIKGTKQLIRYLKDNDVDLIHLHNLHSYCINFPILFRFIKKSKITVVWTFHDCWSFTGHCPHFDMIGCDKWKTGCYHCVQYREYPQGHIDSSKLMYRFKKKWFNELYDLTIVTPSKWLGNLVKESFLKNYPVRVINNGIDLNIFKPAKSSFKDKYNLENKYIILGTAFGWNERKGLDVFIEFSKRLDKKYQIVLVGTDDNIDSQLPDNIISIHRTQNQQELAEIYSSADLFVNPTREENYPTVNMESLACGTPVLTFNTGGSPEVIDETCGSVVAKNDIDAMEKEIIRICETKPYSEEACLERAKAFDMNDRFKEYIDLYEEIMNDRSSKN